MGTTFDLAVELSQWFESVSGLTEKNLFSIAPEGPHRDAIAMDSMIRNARVVYRAELDSEGKLYSPLCFFLVAACHHLRVHLGAGHWRAALQSLCSAKEVPGLESFGLSLGTPASRFQAELNAAVEQSGFLGGASLLSKEDRKVAVGLAVNWAMRLLLAYAADYPKPDETSGRQDFAWLAAQVRAALADCA